MRGMDERQENLFTMSKLEDFVPADHPLRPIRVLVNDALKKLNGLFHLVYADTGRASIAPEKLATSTSVFSGASLFGKASNQIGITGS
jgi:hypothetical protein